MILINQRAIIIGTFIAEIYPSKLATPLYFELLLFINLLVQLYLAVEVEAGTGEK